MTSPILTPVALHAADLDASIAFFSEFRGLGIVHGRLNDDGGRAVWRAEPGREGRIIFVLIGGGRPRPRPDGESRHLDFACASREEVDRIAARARERPVSRSVPGPLHGRPRPSLPILNRF